jgi:LmbE family N-acetylglucosaminyl deacetylase
VSPHCDDAVFACGALLHAHPGAVVVTVFAGSPPAGSTPTEWDAAAGFVQGDDPVARRREEDRRALTLLDARPVWLPFRDRQYGRSAPPAAVAAVLETVVRAADATAVVLPLGLFHDDHACTHEAGLVVLGRLPALAWFAYEDAIYRRFPGDLPGRRLTRLARAGFRPVPVRLAVGSEDTKRRAIACYRSQLRALATPGRPGHADAFAAERYWRIA